MLVLFLSLVVSGNGFLLNAFQNESGQAISNGQFLTVAEFYGEKNLQHQDIERLRQDVDKKLALLANQLQQQLATLSAEAIRNETKRDMMLLAQKYTTLERDYNKLQTSHIQLQNAHTVLQGQLNIQSRLNNNTDTKIRKSEKEIEILSNKSIAMDNELSTLKHLANIKPLQDISALQQNVQILNIQTHTLNMKEQARSQDFLALFNMTIESKKDVSVRLNNQTVAMSALENRMNYWLKDFENYGNLSLLLDKIIKNSEKVALMALNEQNIVVSGVLKFDSVNFNVGFNNISTFIDTGKLVIEKSGLYMISVSIVSNTNSALFSIYLNGKIMSQNRFSVGSWNTGTDVIALQLDKDDKIWVQTGQIQVSGGSYNTFSIIKVK